MSLNYTHCHSKSLHGTTPVPGFTRTSKRTDTFLSTYALCDLLSQPKEILVIF